MNDCPGSGWRWATEDEIPARDRRNEQDQVDSSADDVDGDTRGGSLFGVMEPDEDAFCGRRHGSRYV